MDCRAVGTISWSIIIKLLKTSDKENLTRVRLEKRNSVTFLLEITQIKRSWNTSLKKRGKNPQSRILYPAKNSFQNQT